jgi:serine/threonine-protein kinase
LVHRDVTPRNILVRLPDGAAKLADFGLASSALEPSAKRAPDVMGTPGYVAPEVLGGGRPSPLSDLYSVGVLAYRFLVGPSRGRPHDPDATAPRATTARRMPPLAEARPDLSRPLVEAVQQAVAYNPGARQESVAKFGAQLVDASKARLEVSELKSGSVLRAA